MARENKAVALLTDDVTISTATITIKALQVGKKQMTQSVFRQLPTADLVNDSDIDLNGVPWGWVNYLNDRGGRSYVFQDGTRLFRDTVVIRTGEWLRNCYSVTDYPYHRPAWLENLRTRFRLLADAWLLASLLDGRRPSNEKGEKRFYWNTLSYGQSPAWGCTIKSNAMNETTTTDVAVLGSAGDGKMFVNLFLGFDDGHFPYVCESTARSRLMESSRSEPSSQQIGAELDRMKSVEQAKEKANYESARRDAEGVARRRIAVALRVPVERVAALEGKGGKLSAAVAEHLRRLEVNAAEEFARWNALMEQLRGVEQLFIAC